MNSVSGIDPLFGDVSETLAAIASAIQQRGGDGVTEFLSRLSVQDFGRRTFAAPEPQTQRVTRYLPQCLAEAKKIEARLVAKLAATAKHLHWRQSASYSDALMGEGFLDNYGWCEMIGPHGFFPGDDFRLGLLLLGPDREYRDHFHPAPELYWPLTGPTRWRKGTGRFCKQRGGTVIWHDANMIHATRTGSRPLLAVWCWTRDTARPAQLVRSSTTRFSRGAEKSAMPHVTKKTGTPPIKR